MLLIAVLPVVALFNVFGQRPETTTARSPAASLLVYAPSHVRGGLLYTARFEITAHQELGHPRLILAPGWAEQLTLNAIGPQPVSQASEHGRLDLILGHMSAGKKAVLWISYQVNPTNVGNHDQDVSLDDGNRRLLTVHRSFTVFP